MDTVWLGVKLTIGLAVGFVVIAILLRLIAKVRAFIISARFVSAGCVYQPSGVPGAPSGWLIRDITNDAFAGLLAGTFASNIFFHVAWSAKRRPRTWVLLIGGLVVLTAVILDRDPSLAPVLTVVGVLGSMLVIFILFYLRSRSGRT